MKIGTIGDKISAIIFQYGEPVHICQGIMTHLTNETFKEMNEDTIIGIDEEAADNNANNNNINEDANENDKSTTIQMRGQVSWYDSMTV